MIGDRTTRPPGEAAEFQTKFESFVKELHPDYERNKIVRGTRHECLRELLPGVFASHNVVCWKGTYYHGFCITFHRELASPYLLSPFVIGGRFEQYRGAKLWYFRDVEPNRKWAFGNSNFSDSHSYRKGWESIVEKCVRVAEDKMLPHYLAKVTKHKEPLLHLLESLVALGEIPLNVHVNRNELPLIDKYPFDYDMQVFIEAFGQVRKNRDAFLQNVLYDKPELFNRIREMKSLPDLLTTLRS